MAEVVLRRGHKRVDRWMPRKRFWTRGRIRAGMDWALRIIPGYLLMFSQAAGMPSGLSVALAASRALSGGDVSGVCQGSAAALAVQAISGQQPHWELLLSLLIVRISSRWLNAKRGNGLLMALTGGSLVPMMVAAFLAPTAGEAVRILGGAALAVLSAPVFLRAERAWQERGQLDGVETRLAIGYFLVMTISGGARMTLLGVNIGVAGASLLTLLTAMALGSGAGVTVGLMAGITLCLMGLPLQVCIALPVGAFLAGVVQQMDRRVGTCIAFGAGAHLPLALYQATGVGIGMAVWAAPLVLLLLPRRALEPLLQAVRRFQAVHDAPGDAYASAALSSWEKTIAALAQAVPSPRDETEKRTGEWWESHLCADCPARAACGVMALAVSAERAESIWAKRAAADETWQNAVEQLRGLGCGRLYHLMDSMHALRLEDERKRRDMQEADAQRSMLVTHLLALSGAARRFAALSGSADGWDAATEKRIRAVLDTTATPAHLHSFKRVGGHMQAAFRLEGIIHAREQAEELCHLLSSVTHAPMQVSAVDEDLVFLTEQPIYQVQIAHKSRAAIDDAPCGDSSCITRLSDGRQLVILSDGMGHGEGAAHVSGQAVELLRLCLDAGYQQPQALTAVNGMLLMGGTERFATVDLLTVDLWTGHAALNKLSTSPTMLCREGEITFLTGDALPLGIVDCAESAPQWLALRPGDVLVMITDGVEDAFADRDALTEAVQDALLMGDSASALLEAAEQAADGRRADDQSAIVLRFERSRG